MNDLPAPTTEGELIRQARDLAIPRLSIRAAAARVGLSPEHWGNIERGYRYTKPGDPPRPFSAPAATLAKMAHALRITPERLESEGQRPDAAEMLREIIRQQRADEPSEFPQVDDGPDDLPDVSPELKRAMTVHLRSILDRLEVVRGMNPSARITGEMMFPPNVASARARERNRRSAASWDNLATVFGSWKPESIAMGLAVMRADVEAAAAVQAAERNSRATG